MYNIFNNTQYQNQVAPLQEIAHKENLDLTAFKLDILVEADRNLVSSYKWMYKKSYFKNYLPKLQIQEEKI